MRNWSSYLERPCGGHVEKIDFWPADDMVIVGGMEKN